MAISKELGRIPDISARGLSPSYGGPSQSQCRKAKAVLSEFALLEPRPDLKYFAYLSIGGGDGYMAEQVLLKTAIRLAYLFELDSASCGVAAKRASQVSAKGKTLKIWAGDVCLQIQRALSELLELRRKGLIAGLAVELTAVLHELPYRSADFDLNHFIGSLSLGWPEFILLLREPCCLSNNEWPMQVEIAVNGFSSRALEALALDIKAKLTFQGSISAVSNDFLSMPRDLAIEMLHKLFYLDSYPYELQERLTGLDPNYVAMVVQKVLGKNTVQQRRFTTTSFASKYRSVGVSARNTLGQELSIPMCFFSLVGYRFTSQLR